MMPGRQGRVVASHSIARRAFLLAAVFAGVALVWTVVVMIRGGSWWGPLHAFLAGTVLLAISGASQMFTITWAAATPPRASVSGAQRWLVASGTATVLVGVTAKQPWLVWIGAAAVVAGLVTLALSILAAVRRSLLRRFDLSGRFYLLAFASGVVGVTLGALMGGRPPGASFATHRLVHSHLNLVGLVGFTIVGTIPTFLPTVAHHRAVSGREAVVAWWACVAAAAAMAGGLFLPPPVVGVGVVLTGAAGALMLAGIVSRLWSRGRGRSPFLQVSAGMVWLVGWAMVDGVSLLAGSPHGPFAGWTAAGIVAGVGQVLAGSLAYLLPVLAGPPLATNVRIMTSRPALPLVAATVTGVGLGAGWSVLAVVAGALWVADLAVRLARLAFARRRQGEAT